jgi:hypothetical protein
MTTPEAKLDVEGDALYAGRFTTDYITESTHVIHAEAIGPSMSDGIAVYGESVPSAGYGFGGWFKGGDTGVYGEVHPTGSGYYYGVSGKVATGGSGLAFGVSGVAEGDGTNYGVYGHASGDGTTNMGVYADASGSATNYAGYFNGLLYASSASASIKAFKIDHPLDPGGKYLNHSSVESPDMMNIYNGNAVLDAGGSAWVELPDWFEALNGDFRYQLTCIGGFAKVYIADEIRDNRFRIAGGAPDMKVSWQVTGIRHDPLANARRVTVEEVKPTHEIGRYLNPEVYGAPRESGIGYHTPPERKEAKEALTRG